MPEVSVDWAPVASPYDSPPQWQTLSDRLRGNRAFDTDQVTKIADYLGLDLIELFTRRGAA